MQANRESVRAFCLQPYILRERCGEFLERRAFLMARATKTTAQLTGMPGGGGSDREELYAALADMSGECRGVLCEYIKAVDSLDALVADAPLTSRQREVLDMRYRQFKPWRGIIAALNMSERNAYYEHTRALDICVDYINRVNPVYWRDV